MNVGVNKISEKHMIIEIIFLYIPKSYSSHGTPKYKG